MAERDDNPQKPDLVEEADLESFPASDPPSWTLGVLGAKALGDPDAQTRAERDSMGEVRVPKDALYGAQTQRAIDNFPAAAYRLQPAFFRAMGLIKACAAAANLELGGLSKTKAEAIGRAADEIGRGGHNEQFAISVYQTGSAT